jgi:tRNA dimethylallyltransferase
MKYNLITILGPTAVGKTRLASLLANEFNGEIISADSRQVYRRMNLGTGKDYDDYIVNGSAVPFYMIDIAEPAEEFNLYLFQEKFFESFRMIKAKNKNPFLAGGTGLYLNAIINNYDLVKVEASDERIEELNRLTDEELRNILLNVSPRLHNKTDLEIKERIIRAILVAESKGSVIKKENISSLNIGVLCPREVIKQRITERLKQRLKTGMVEEVEGLLKEGLIFEKLAFFGLEYKFIGLYLKKEITYNDMFQKLNSAIHAFAKRQMTWYRKMEKEGTIIHWLDGNNFEEAKEIINSHYFTD